MIALMSLPAVVGHIVLWVCAWNHINGSGMSRRRVTFLSRTCFAACGLGPFAVALGLYSASGAFAAPATVYFAFCFTVTTVTLPWEYVRRWRARQHNGIRRESSRVHRFPAEQRRSAQGATGGKKLMLQSAVNQAFEIEENEKELELARLVPGLDGLTIAHISDLHFTGDIDQTWFSAAIDLVNEMKPDLIAITGDLVDNQDCNHWLATTVGRLKAPCGVFYILGNHDGKQDPSVLRDTLNGLGLKDLSGRWFHVSVAGQDLFLAGDEAPWGPGIADPGRVPSRQWLPQTRILLAHSPDSIQNAQDADIDLMLAGHTHGGQFCVPGFGAVVCPMQKPLELATGSIYRHPTLMHVSRGLSGELPLRLNCRPEISRLVLRSLQLPEAEGKQTSREALGDHQIDQALSIVAPQSAGAEATTV